ncbi:hypothetical protein E2C01_009110 [Portunus trituberculatus]|uniref:Uncharacterized protein n=1 Tax=Portunus trituberculatus TaxID=210409 RepID=A0A5B7D2K7_PORTR|nr:hypothetical protein [Portunus trituberculatus]
MTATPLQRVYPGPVSLSLVFLFFLFSLLLLGIVPYPVAPPTVHCCLSYLKFVGFSSGIYHIWCSPERHPSEPNSHCDAPTTAVTC